MSINIVSQVNWGTICIEKCTEISVLSLTRNEINYSSIISLRNLKILLTLFHF